MRNLPGTVAQIADWAMLPFKTQAKFPSLLILHTMGKPPFPPGTVWDVTCWDVVSASSVWFLSCIPYPRLSGILPVAPGLSVPQGSEWCVEESVQVIRTKYTTDVLNIFSPIFRSHSITSVWKILIPNFSSLRGNSIVPIHRFLRLFSTFLISDKAGSPFSSSPAPSKQCVNGP